MTHRMKESSGGNRRRAAWWLLVLVIGLALPGVSRGQAGSIRGQVVDAVTQEPLPGVNVVVVGTLQGAATDVDGRFTIEPVAPGTYVVQASSVGFTAQAKTDVVVQPSRPTL